MHIHKHGVPNEDNMQKVNPEASVDGDNNKKRSNAYNIDLNDIEDNEFDNSRENIYQKSGRSNQNLAKSNAGRARRR